MADREQIKTALLRPARAAAVFIGHLLLGSIVICGIWLTHWLFLALWGEQDPKFFDWIPVRWVFDASEFGVMIVFVIRGILEADHKMRR